MSKRPATVFVPNEGPTIGDLLDEWKLYLQMQGASKSTITNYMAGIRRFEAWLTTEGRSTCLGTVDRKDAIEWLAKLRTEPTRSGKELKPSAHLSYYRWLCVFWKYVAAEGEGPNIMANVPKPKAEPVLINPVTEAELKALLATCGTNRFEDRRDMAILLLFWDTGIRLTELGGLALAAVDSANQVVTVMGKGSKPRRVAISEATTLAISRYRRSRGALPLARTSDALWLSRGARGGHQTTRFSTDGIATMIERRAQLAGVRHITPHQFRHAWAGNMKRAGIQQDEMMALAGWSSVEMVNRYGRATVAERALETGRRLSPVTKLGETI
jgi:site-specific recombinase XerD